MINNFVDYINENQVVSLILENDLNASPEFLDRLDKIRDKNKVAQILYFIFHDEYYISKDLPQNWINVTNNPEMISFLSDQRARRTPMQWDEDYSKYYEAPGRGEVGVGRFARLLLTHPDVIEDIESSLEKDHPDVPKIQDLTPKDYEDFVNLYKSEFVEISYRFELISGDDIAKYYDFYNYAYGEKGQLGSSCMRNTSCQKYFGIYQKNPDVCQLLVYLNQNNQVLGRALVWKLEKKVDSCPAEYFMDRIYCANDSDMIKFQNYARKEEWVMKNKNTSDILEGLLFNYNGEVILSHVYVQLKNFEFENYPFVDTLSFLHPVSGRLHNVAGRNTSELTSTSGRAYEYVDSDPRSKVLKYLLTDALTDSNYGKYKDLIKKALKKLSS